MKFSGICCPSRWRSFVLATLLSTGMLFCQTNSVQAAGGSWGGSLGSGGSGGSWGSGGSGGSSGGGLLGGRQPLRNLLGRVGGRFSGGSGGSSGFSSHGSSGSTGTWASSGSSLGSTGSSWGSSGSSVYGSSGGSSGGYVGSSYGSSGYSYLSSLGSYETSYVGTAPVYSEPVYSSSIYDSGGIIGSSGFDSGYFNGVPMDTGYADQGIPVEGGMINSDSFNPVPGIYYEGSNGSSGSTLSGSESVTPPTPPSSTNPGPEGSDDSTSIENTNDQSVVLNLVLPADAKVYINDKLTKTPGAQRSYVSRNLKPANDYHYKVKAVVVRDGKEMVRTSMVKIATGSTETVNFDFDSAPVTTLALSVPADAKVKLCGNETKATGDLRQYMTSKLEAGTAWEGYTIEVSVERNGKVVRQEKKLDLLAGESYSFDFEFDSLQSKVAAN